MSIRESTVAQKEHKGQGGVTLVGEKVDFSRYHGHLERVSRSFSFCILQLDSPAKEWVALGYLLCRIVDTIEDSNWPNQEQQTWAFQQFKLFLTHEPSQEEYVSWLQAFPADLPSEERILLEDLFFLLAEKNKLPSVIHQQLIQTTTQMADGMRYFIDHYMINNTLSLNLLTTTNQYCFFVAGVVGEWLTSVFTQVIPKFELTDTLLNQAFHFGLFLQKINILKDQRSDILVGRHFFSSRAELRESLIVNAQQTMAYLKTIPVVAGRPYRIFCAWSFFIGLASLKWIDKSARMNHPYKLGSRETTHLLAQVKQRIDDNYALETLFYRYFPEGKVVRSWGDKVVTIKEVPLWFSAIYPVDSKKINVSMLGIGVT